MQPETVFFSALIVITVQCLILWLVIASSTQTKRKMMYEVVKISLLARMAKQAGVDEGKINNILGKVDMELSKESI